MSAVVIGIGNEFRHDDAIGLRLIAELAALDLPGVQLVESDSEPTRLLTDWVGADLAVVVDAVRCAPAEPGRIHRTDLAELPPAQGAASSHGLGVPDTIGLARVLDRLPAKLVVFAVEAADLELGVGLTPQVAAALPQLVERVRAELATARSHS